MTARPSPPHPNVASKRTNACAMWSVPVLLPIRMHRKQATCPLCLFRNLVRIELSYKEQHKGTIGGIINLVFFITYLCQDKIQMTHYTVFSPTLNNRSRRFCIVLHFLFETFNCASRYLHRFFHRTSMNSKKKANSLFMP